MSPEAPGNLVVLDLYLDPAAAEEDPPSLRCHVVCHQPTAASENRFIDVSWNADAAHSGWVAVANGVAYAKPPPDYERTSYDAEVPRAGGRYHWQHPVHGLGLMLIAVLPRGFVLARAADADPRPEGIKTFQGRMAVYWWIAGRPRGSARWALTRSDPGEVAERCKALREEVLAAPRPRTRDI